MLMQYTLGIRPKKVQEMYSKIFNISQQSARKLETEREECLKSAEIAWSVLFVAWLYDTLVSNTTSSLIYGVERRSFTASCPGLHLLLKSTAVIPM